MNNDDKKIYDMHAHIFPGKIAAKAVDSISKFYSIEMAEKGTAEDLIVQGGKAGVKKYLVCSTATTGVQVPAINGFIANKVCEHPEFIGFGSLHPDYENTGDEVERMISLGLKGIKLHPDFQHFDIDAPKAYPIYDAAQGRLPILIHMGDIRYDYSRPYRLMNILKQFPRLKVIAAHLGGYQRWDEVKRLDGYLGNPNIYIDTCSAIQFLPSSVSEEIIRAHGTERVFWGTDYPMWDHVTEYNRFMQLKLTDKEKEQILWKNAESFLKPL